MLTPFYDTALQAPRPRYHTTACPPEQEPLYSIGRTMFETDTIPSEWVDRSNFMDEIWVPTQFHADTFAAAGVHRSKLYVLPEPVDTTFFNPHRKKTLPTKLPLGKAIFPRVGAATGDRDTTDGAARQARPTPYRFFSVFKFEERKGQSNTNYTIAPPF